MRYDTSGILVLFTPQGPDEYALAFTRPGGFTLDRYRHLLDSVKGTPAGMD